MRWARAHLPPALAAALVCCVGAPHRPASDTLVGTYFRGDGLGFNQSLDLHPDGTFRCGWSGCLGDYGSASGTWMRAGDRVVMTTLAAEGNFVEQPLGDLDLVLDGRRLGLIEPENRESGEEGLSRLTRFEKRK